MEDPEDENYQDEMDMQSIKKMFSALEKQAKKTIDYLVTEGFMEPTGTPGEYQYTPEGLVLIQQKYKKMQEEGLL
jgi:predicted transcriptional regulator